MKNLIFLVLLLVNTAFGAGNSQIITASAPLVLSSGVMSVSQTLPFQVMTLQTQSTPSNPASGRLKMYFKSDGSLYSLNSSGTETQIGSGGGGGGVTTVGAFSGSSQTNGASISSTTITFGPADGSNPGMVSTGAQTWAGVKSFSSAPIFSSGTVSTVPYLNASKALTSSAVTPTELGYLSGVTSAIQTQIAAKAPSASPTFSGTIGTPLTFSRVVITDSSGNLSVSSVTPTTLAFLDVGSSLTTLLAAKAPLASPTFSGTITTPLTVSRALVTGASSELAVATTTAAEIDFVSGVTSAIQTQLNLKAALASPTFTGIVKFPDGTVTAPGLVTTTSTTTGLYYVGSGSLGFSSNGVIAGKYNSDTTWVLGGTLTTAAHAINGNIKFDCGSTNTCQIRHTDADGALALEGSNTTANGSIVRVYGQSHASFPNRLRFMIGATENGWFDSSGNFGVTNLTASKPVFTASDKTLTSTGTMPNSQGGTGGDSSASTGIAHVSSGTWSYSAINLANSDVTGTLAAGNGGTGSAFTAFSGPLTSTKTFTLPNASATILTTNDVVTAAQGGTGVANNSASTITISGNFATTLTVSGTTSITLPTSGTIVNTNLTGSLWSYPYFLYGTVSNDTYTVEEYAPFGCTVNTVALKLASGTATVALKINGTSITSCSAISVTSTQSVTTCTAANAIAANDRLTLVTTAGSSPTNLAATVKCTR